MEEGPYVHLRGHSRPDPVIDQRKRQNAGMTSLSHRILPAVAVAAFAFASSASSWAAPSATVTSSNEPGSRETTAAPGDAAAAALNGVTGGKVIETLLSSPSAPGDLETKPTSGRTGAAMNAASAPLLSSGQAASAGGAGSLAAEMRAALLTDLATQSSTGKPVQRARDQSEDAESSQHRRVTGAGGTDSYSGPSAGKGAAPANRETLPLVRFIRENRVEVIGGSLMMLAIVWATINFRGAKHRKR